MGGKCEKVAAFKGSCANFSLAPPTVSVLLLFCLTVSSGWPLTLNHTHAYFGLSDTGKKTRESRFEMEVSYS